jgi:hypothetical protein
MLDGRRVAELRSAAGAQELTDVAERESEELLELARTRSVDVDQFTLRESPPYTLIGIDKTDGSFDRIGGVDDRDASCFDTTRQNLAARYRDQVKEAITRYRDSHSLESWLRGTSLAALVLGIYILRLEQRQYFFLQHLDRLGISALVQPEQVRRLMQRARQVIHWTLLLMVSYLLSPLLLGLFPPTRGVAEGLQDQPTRIVVGFLRTVVVSIPNLLSIALIVAIAILLIRANNAVFEALRLDRIRIPGFYREWCRTTARLVGFLIILAALAFAYPYVGPPEKAERSPRARWPVAIPPARLFIRQGLHGSQRSQIHAGQLPLRRGESATRRRQRHKEAPAASPDSSPAH